MRTWNIRARSARPAGNCFWKGWTVSFRGSGSREAFCPFYPKPGKGRRPYPLPVMLRVHCVQLFYNLSDPGMEDLLYEAESVRRFVGLKLSDALPDETTILNFRHLLERHGLGKSLFEEINRHLEPQGLRLREGAYVHGRWYHLRDVAGGSVIFGTAIHTGSRSPSCGPDLTVGSTIFEILR